MFNMRTQFIIIIIIFSFFIIFTCMFYLYFASVLVLHRNKWPVLSPDRIPKKNKLGIIKKIGEHEMSIVEEIGGLKIIKHTTVVIFLKS